MSYSSLPSSGIHHRATTTTSAFALTSVLFFILPFFQLLGDFQREFASVESKHAYPPPPPPPPEQPPPPPEPEMEQEIPELLEDTPFHTHYEIEAMLLPGQGGAGGDFRFRAFASAVENLDRFIVFDPFEIDEVPRPVYQVAPVYPYELRRAGVSGHVHVSFIVDENGNVRSPRIDSSSHRQFEQPALDAIVQWRFEPGMKDGEAVRTRMILPLAFNVRR